MGSMISGLLVYIFLFEFCEFIIEEVELDVCIQEFKDNESIFEYVLIISGICIKLDGDVSVDSGFMKYIKIRKNKNGGVLKRLVKVLGLEKKSVEVGRRGSM